ncbi:MAG: hypothetical protein C6I00_06135 [Nitratiruptor sp.]|nr:hypothetical protein [Nitratiruptor sp.]NPA83022.1 hypothetical protein [Campylobacterota bacterium]
MKGSGFTLIEAIFVGIVITILTLVAVPKYEYFKHNAKASAVIKTTIDAALNAAQGAIHSFDFEQKEHLTLEDIVRLTDSGWSYSNDGGGMYRYIEGGSVIASITLDKRERVITYTIDCTKFTNAQTMRKCKELIGNPEDGKLTDIIEF